ncbi:sigma 54-interacting transcriptional regulator [Clostridium sp. NSJ-6]|uniref:Sigma 54-interacting transcriptional regulator n=1 Tax=Clostridium hominis TaxID=2763036 RepID=A0ABR7DA95_9CLOT|nr:sigma 54-interacting transcriptional regulator [Clostridium hominis]MBC5628311.1 sigma 54-interacting transcriptional regulator [Clostridium hominis]MDU2670998.1 sigma 54-interacting transcriptional regulator [Clostridium sp.]
MNSLYLKNIQESVIRYASVISNILKIDVEIVDEGLNRIAGTGIFKNKINENIKKNGFVYEETINKKRIQLIENPGEHRLCRKCLEKDNCLEKMEVSFPIIYENRVIGVIGVVCSTIEQKNRLLNDLSTIVSFIEQISELIAAKVSEYSKEIIQIKSLEFFKEIVNSVNDGVIVVGSNSLISSINKKGENELKLKSSVKGKKITIDETDDNFNENSTYQIKIDETKYEVVGRLIQGSLDIKEYSKILIFNKLMNIKQEAVTLTYGNNKTNLSDIVGESDAMKSLKKKIKSISNLKSTVLITGESGTGKELVARAIHAEGERRNKPFIAINCGAIPESLLESELFGYVKGAFSGANANGRIGKFELANKGVIFLDEIGDMPLYLQVKLLRVLQEKTVVRIGSNKLTSLDIRIVAATNKDLKELVRKGKFREDLYYRLNVIPIEVPALRERGKDLNLLVNVLVDKYNNLFNKYVSKIDAEVLEMFRKYKWQGNVRELENVVEFMVSLSDKRGVVDKSMLPESFIENYNELLNDNIDRSINIKQIIPLKDIEKLYIKKAIEKYGNTTEGKKIAAKKLGIGIATLYRKIDGLE